MNESQAVLRIKNLSVGYLQQGKIHAILKDISLSACAGELIALIGINGSGKSTLLKTIVNFQKPFSGEIFFNEKKIESYSLVELARQISFVSTEKIEVPQMTVYELIALGRFPHTGWFGGLSLEDKKIIDEVIEKTGMQEFRSKNILEISDGEKQRTMIARALVQDTAVIVLDEPTAFLDIKNRIETVQLLKQLAVDHKKTIIYSTHDLNIALQMADKIWLLCGTNVTEGAPEDLILNGKLAQTFSSEKICFDAEKGDFIFQQKPTENIQLIGEGFTYEWTKKALQRNGFEAIESECPIAIKISSENNKMQWDISKNNSNQTAFCIYDLIEVLKKC